MKTPTSKLMSYFTTQYSSPWPHHPDQRRGRPYQGVVCRAEILWRDPRREPGAKGRPARVSGGRGPAGPVLCRGCAQPGEAALLPCRDFFSAGGLGPAPGDSLWERSYLRGPDPGPCPAAGPDQPVSPGRGRRGGAHMAAPAGEDLIAMIVSAFPALPKRDLVKTWSRLNLLRYGLQTLAE